MNNNNKEHYAHEDEVPNHPGKMVAAARSPDDVNEAELSGLLQQSVWSLSTLTILNI
jgi:hypothetical protein